uniref:C2H2-type domain-containing protein n=1 Tax=Sinocyclocheilus grahami TaxID=75366 RepID=A0A672NHQ0_SINGR
MFKVFPGKRSFGRHRCKAVETLYNCPVCDKQFKIKQNMLDHQTLHTGEKPYCCEICGAFYSCERYLKNHQKSHIEKTYEYLCELCDKRTSFCSVCSPSMIAARLFHFPCNSR